MAGQGRAADGEDDTLDLTEDMELDDAEADEQAADGDEPPATEEDEDAGADDEGDGPPAFDEGEAEEGEEGENAVIRRMRERINELANEAAELRRSQPAPMTELGPKPTLESCDFDEEEYDRQKDAWNDHRRKIEDGQAAQRAAQETVQREWQSDIESYNRQREELKLPDFDHAADVVKTALTLAQQAVIVKAASRPAAFVYALSKSDARLSELAKVQDPIKLAAAIARMEGGIKVVKKRKAPAPDRAASGTGKMPGGTDKQLEKLEAEAERTGNRTQVIAYKKKLKNAKK